MRLRDANVQDAPAIADLWNPIIRDTLNTFTTEEKTIIALETAISAPETRPWCASLRI